MNSLPKTVTRQRRDCDLNPGSSVPESSTLTTRLPSHPYTTDLIACFKILRGFTNIILSECSVWSSCSTRDHSTKLYYPDSRVTVRQNFFSVCVVQLWNKLPEAVSASSVNALSQ